ncbi:hypothetical protein M413DRAFT_428331 [Hebeloma cylindrosporum]|uniref:F-box domain-containing protein n=1 Tax=Hebeloma cylindrosporum TaxID=76867 RepID=A0A0C2XD59_HEBCY|nr:hypothetical protein M413DRAFT_428331 [Hebeloma cylindrosporum h7]
MGVVPDPAFSIRRIKSSLSLLLFISYINHCRYSPAAFRPSAQTLSSMSGTRSIYDTIRLIDRRIASLRESIHALNRQRNELLPISKLPVEIVTEIFLLHQENLKPQGALEKATLDWIRISHVCKRWREIALCCSRLWIHIPFRHPEWANEMILRSYPACLIAMASFHSESSPKELETATKFFKEHLSRVQVLDIWDSSAELVAKLFQDDIKPTSAPYLSILRLGTPRSRKPDSPVPNLLQIVDNRLLNTSSLREVEALSTPNWDLNLFSGLTHLKLGDGSNGQRTQTSQCEFLDALRRMSTLQFLHLNGPFLPAAADGSPLEPVHLSNLRDLLVYDTVDIVTFFLHHIDFPAVTRTTINCRLLGPGLPLTQLSPIIPLLKQRLAERPHTLKIDHIRFCSVREPPSPAVLKFEGWVSSGHPSWLEEFINDQDFPSDTPDFGFFVEIESFADFDGLRVGMFDIFPQNNIIYFCVSSDDFAATTPNALFARKLGQLPALEALSLLETPFAPFLLELGQGDIQHDTSTATMTYPALRYMDFNNAPHVPFPPLISLYNCLKKRSERGLGPHRLAIYSGDKLDGANKRAIDLLEEIVELFMFQDTDSVESASSSDAD